MIVTLRTIPRSNRQTSVVLTRAPSSPLDPEVMGQFVTSRAAVAWMLDMLQRIKLKAGDAMKGFEGRYNVRTDGPSSATIRIELELEPDDKAVYG